MVEQLAYRFEIKRINKPTESEYITALRIYNETTPVEIKTNTNEITFWMQKSGPELLFDTVIFVLYLDDIIVGLAMVSYLRKTKIAIIEYLAVRNQYRVNAVFFPYINLLQNYMNTNNFDVSYYINEISNKDNGNNIDKESRLFKKLICLEGFGKVEAPYITLPLGLLNHESSFDAHIYLKSSDDIHSISKDTYLSIVNSIYYDYFYVWYSQFLSTDDLSIYKNRIDLSFEAIKKTLSTQTICKIQYANCPLLKAVDEEKTHGPLPTTRKSRNSLIPLLALVLLICPVAIIWIYNFILDWLGIQLSSVGNIIGGFISASITSISALILSKKKS